VNSDLLAIVSGVSKGIVYYVSFAAQCLLVRLLVVQSVMLHSRCLLYIIILLLFTVFISVIIA